MGVGLLNREIIRQISPGLEEELDNIIAGMQNRFLVEHDDQGHHTNIKVTGITTPTPAERNPQNQTPSVSNYNTINKVTLPSSIVPSSSGSGDVVGPAGATADDICLYSGVTGKVIKDSGKKISDLALQTDLTSYVSKSSVLGLIAVSVTLSDSSIKSLNTVPIDVVPATGVSNEILVPIQWTIQKKFPSNAYSANPQLDLKFAGSATATMEGITPGLNSATAYFAMGKQNNPSYTTLPTNTRLQVKSTADVTSVGDTTGNQIAVTVLYFIVGTI